jgi:hypothetical protein
MFDFWRRRNKVTPVVPEPPKVIPMTFCAVCKKPIIPGDSVLELRHGRLGQLTDQKGFFVPGVFIHTTPNIRSCLTESTLYHQLSSLGLNLEQEDLPAPWVVNPAKKTRSYIDGTIPVIPIFAKLEEPAPASLRVLPPERRRSSWGSFLDD